MAGYIGSKSSVTQVDGYTEAEADAEFVNDPNGTITVSGSNVGIGTSSPNKISGHTMLSVNTATATQYAGVDISTADAVRSALYANNGGTYLETRTSTPLVLGTNTTERMRIDSSGNVGIGTSSPSSSYKVTIDGDASMIRMNHTGAGGNGTLDLGVNSTMATIIANYSTTAIPLRFLTGAQERMRIDSSGKILINRTSTAEDTKMNINHGTSWGLVLDGDGSGTDNHIMFSRSGGTRGYITSSSSSVSYNTSSDYRLKENVVDLTGASARVNQLDVKRFNFIADETNTLVDGFLAHEVATVVPEAITGTHNEVEVWKDGDELPDGVSVGDNKLDDDGNTIPVYQGIDQSKLVPLLTAALQEALTEIASLKTRVEALEA